MIDYYKNKGNIIEIDATRTIDEVYYQTKVALNK